MFFVLESELVSQNKTSLLLFVHAFIINLYYYYYIIIINNVIH